MEFAVWEEIFCIKYFQTAKSFVSTHTDALGSAEYGKDAQPRLPNPVAIRLQRRAHQRDYKVTHYICQWDIWAKGSRSAREDSVQTSEQTLCLWPLAWSLDVWAGSAEVLCQWQTLPPGLRKVSWCWRWAFNCCQQTPLDRSQSGSKGSLTLGNRRQGYFLPWAVIFPPLNDGNWPNADALGILKTKLCFKCRLPLGTLYVYGYASMGSSHISA